MELALREWERDATNSDIHPEEWDQAKRTEVKGRLLKNLQVSSDPNAVMVVGRSTFKTTDTLRPDAEPDREQLRKFARKVGATTVVWSRKEVGKADAIVQEPVTSYSTGSEFSHGNRFDRASTVWVPIRIKKNESAFVAVFLR